MQMNGLIPNDWLDGAPNGAVIHWTGGGPYPSAEDKRHYHLIIDQESRVCQGSFLISDNDDTSDQEYAAHTRGFNTKRVGIALCGMYNAIENPFDTGPYPINERQWYALIKICAQLAHHYDWHVTEEVFTFHSRVQQVHGVQQLGKWDISVLPWDRSYSPAAIVEKLLEEISEALGIVQAPVRLDPLLLLMPVADVGRLAARRMELLIANPPSHARMVSGESVAAFQTAHGLTPDGVIGPWTWAALFEMMEKEGAEAPSNDHSA